MGIFRSGSGLEVVKRNPTLALYPFALNDGGAGVLRDFMTNVDATMGGGSDLAAAAKRRNDFQRLTSDFPTLGYRASPAWTNLMYASDSDNPSFEGNTVGDWQVSNGVLAILSTDAWHGSRCCEMTAAGAGVLSAYLVTAHNGMAAGNQYTYVGMVKAGLAGTVGKQIRLALQGDVSGYTYSNTITLSNDWQFVTVTKTFSAGDSIQNAYLTNVGGTGGWGAGDKVRFDAMMIATGATVPQFEESEVVATSCTFPTPFSAGEPFTALFLVWTPWAGNDSVAHTILDCQGTAADQNRVLLQKDAANNLNFNVWDNATAVKQCVEAVNATDWPAGGFKRIAVSRTAGGVLNAYLGGTVFGSLNAGAGTGLETVVGATSYIGTDTGGTTQLNGFLLPFIWRGYAAGDEELQRLSSLLVPPPRTRMVA